jgi:hypothetical protein
MLARPWLALAGLRIEPALRPPPDAAGRADVGAADRGRPERFLDLLGDAQVGTPRP